MPYQYITSKTWDKIESLFYAYSIMQLDRGSLQIAQSHNPVSQSQFAQSRNPYVGIQSRYIMGYADNLRSVDRAWEWIQVWVRVKAIVTNFNLFWFISHSTRAKYRILHLFLVYWHTPDVEGQLRYSLAVPDMQCSLLNKVWIVTDHSLSTVAI